MSNIGKIKRIIRVVPTPVKRPAVIPTIPEPEPERIHVPDWPVKVPAKITNK